MGLWKLKELWILLSSLTLVALQMAIDWLITPSGQPPPPNHHHPLASWAPLSALHLARLIDMIAARKQPPFAWFQPSQPPSFFDASSRVDCVWWGVGQGNPNAHDGLSWSTRVASCASLVACPGRCSSPSLPQVESIGHIPCPPLRCWPSTIYPPARSVCSP